MKTKKEKAIETTQVETEIIKPYKVELSRIAVTTFGKKNKKQTKMAPEGKIFLKVICRDKMSIYSKNFPILIGTPEERIDEMAEQMYVQLKKQFSL